MIVSQPLKAASWMAGAMVSFSLMAISGRELAANLNTFEIMFFRSLIGLVIVLQIGFLTGSLSQIKTNRLGFICFVISLISLDRTYGF